MGSPVRSTTSVTCVADSRHSEGGLVLRHVTVAKYNSKSRVDKRIHRSLFRTNQ
jgi:hypothetical protein